MRVLEPGPDASRADRPASAVLHDESNVRVAAFHLEAGQRVAPHRSASTVVVHVVEGAGTFRGGDGGALLGPGESAVFEPGEEHAIEAERAPLRFLAIIAPGPSA